MTVSLIITEAFYHVHDKYGRLMANRDVDFGKITDFKLKFLTANKISQRCRARLTGLVLK